MLITGFLFIINYNLYTIVLLAFRERSVALVEISTRGTLTKTNIFQRISKQDP
jgi:hypothetical protein